MKLRANLFKQCNLDLGVKPTTNGHFSLGIFGRILRDNGLFALGSNRIQVDCLLLRKIQTRAHMPQENIINSRVIFILFTSLQVTEKTSDFLTPHVLVLVQLFLLRVLKLKNPHFLSGYPVLLITSHCLAKGLCSSSSQGTQHMRNREQKFSLV